MNEALLRNLSDQELVRYAGQQLPPELYSRLVTLFDEREEDISTIEQLHQEMNDMEDSLREEIASLEAEVRSLERELDRAEANQ